jgi:hypothetical protein
VICALALSGPTDAVVTVTVTVTAGDWRVGAPRVMRAEGCRDRVEAIFVCDDRRLHVT